VKESIEVKGRERAQKCVTDKKKPGVNFISILRSPFAPILKQGILIVLGIAGYE